VIHKLVKNISKKLWHIRVQPLAFESLGVRSMATLVETPSTTILLDAGVSLAPYRFGYTPHPKEYKALIEARERIQKAADKAEVVTISHYHFDHHTPSFQDYAFNWTEANITASQIYQDKLVLAKDYKKDINASQRRRGWVFTKTSGRNARKIEVADNKAFTFSEDTEIKFSKPVPHGSTGSPLGYVLMVTIRYRDEKVIFASDVQGPIVRETLYTILLEKPLLLIIGGPPTYLADFRLQTSELQGAIENLKILAQNVPTIILDHHLLRDQDWRKAVKPAWKIAKRYNHKIVTAAEYLSQPNTYLEAYRAYLYEEELPTQEFQRWSKLPLEKRKNIKPPL
jgi:predicted metallo-beta-lactamase superfamily hydrolase